MDKNEALKQIENNTEFNSYYGTCGLRCHFLDRMSEDCMLSNDSLDTNDDGDYIRTKICKIIFTEEANNG